MPTYQYRCKDCGSDLEVQQKFTDAALTECPTCDGGQLRKIYNAVGVHFKGSGFYRTDSRSESSNGAAKGSAKSAEGSGGTGTKSDSGTAAKSDSGSTGSTAGGSGTKATTPA